MHRDELPPQVCSVAEVPHTWLFSAYRGRPPRRRGDNGSRGKP
ncbi:MAG: hypothetical protein R2856_33995 [Caldilineaceae bacterium]